MAGTNTEVDVIQDGDQVRTTFVEFCFAGKKFDT